MTKQKTKAPRRISLACQALEERLALAAFHSVSTINGLQDAIRNVSNNGVIEVRAGTYLVQQLTNNPEGKFLGANNLTKSFTLRGADGAQVKLDGGQTGDILRIRNPNGNPGHTVTIDNITFQKGKSTSPGGGALSVENANLVVTNTTFLNNRSEQSTGGGAVTVFRTSNASFTNTTFRDNSAFRSGGAMEVSGGATVAIRESTFTNNRVNLAGRHDDTALGGAIHAGNSTLNISSSRFDGNQAAYAGGAIAIQGVWQTPFDVPRARLNITSSTFINNSVPRDAALPPANNAPTEGGAILLEDQVLGSITFTRFQNNTADNAGAVSMFRSTAKFENCHFSFNRALAEGNGRGFGGAIGMISIDSSRDGTVDKPTGSLTVRNSYFEGDPTGQQTVADAAGGIYAGGDRRRLEGRDGVPAGGTVSSNRASLTIDGCVFNQLHVLEAFENGSHVAGSGLGGAIVADLTKLNLTNSVIMNSSVRSPSPATGIAAGGGMALLRNTTATVSNVQFINNSSGRLGGAVYAKGAHLQLSNSALLANRLEHNPSRPSSQGAAIYTTPDNDNASRTASATGLVSNCVFADNTGIAIFESDRSTGSIINAMQYNGNTFFESSWGDAVFVNNIGDNNESVTDLNGLVVSRASGLNTDKSPQGNNQTAASRPIVTALVAGPRSILGARAVGDNETNTVGMVGYVSYGTTSTLQLPDGLGGTRNINVGTAGVVRADHAGRYVLNPQSGMPRTVDVVATSALTVFRNGIWSIDFDRDSTVDRQVTLGQAGDRPFTGDFNDDGLQDIGVFRSGRWLVDFDMNGVVNTEVRFGQGSDRPFLADWDGDGSLDLCVFRSGRWFFDTDRNGTSNASLTFGQTGDVPFVGDWDGNGTLDLGFRRGNVWMVDTNRDGQSDQQVQIGVAGDQPHLDDFNGDGRLDLVYFRNRTWFADVNRNGTADFSATFGNPGDISVAGIVPRTNVPLAGARVANTEIAVGTACDLPIPGDFNADGQLHLGVFRAGNWLFDTGRDGQSEVQSAFGAAGDLPLFGLPRIAAAAIRRSAGTLRQIDATFAEWSSLEHDLALLLTP